MSKTSPYYKRYPTDLWGDARVQMMPALAQTVYAAMLDWAWQLGALEDPEALIERLGAPRDLWRHIKACWVETPEGWVSQRLEQERAEKEALAERNRRNGRKGGRPPERETQMVSDPQTQNEATQQSPQNHSQSHSQSSLSPARESEEIPTGLGGQVPGGLGPRSTLNLPPTEPDVIATARAHPVLGKLEGIEERVSAWRYALEVAGKLPLWRSKETFVAHMSVLARHPDVALEAIKWAELKAHADPEEAIKRALRDNGQDERKPGRGSSRRAQGATEPKRAARRA